MELTPSIAEYAQPEEWALHDGCWLAWPCHEDLWGPSLLDVQVEWSALCRAIAAPGKRRQERLHVLVDRREDFPRVALLLGGLPFQLHPVRYGDIWLRDTAPIALRSPDGERLWARFRFNGWGGKYVLEHDDKVALAVADQTTWPRIDAPFVLEGGAVEVDGQGTCITTCQCLLNPNRNQPVALAVAQEDIEGRLKAWLGVRKIIWLDHGLQNDHTDGHVDTLARFLAPGVVACMRPQNDDPNAAALNSIFEVLSASTDAVERRVEVIALPSPGRVETAEGALMPASYLNFYIANNTVVVPTYGVANDDLAVRRLAECFKDRQVVGCSARAILAGGGAFHCITQQIPAGKETPDDA